MYGGDLEPHVCGQREGPRAAIGVAHEHTARFLIEFTTRR
jgi:hypothetical protein